MHFGKIIKSAAYANGLSAAEFAALLSISESRLLNLYEQREWTTGYIKLVSEVLNHDFCRHLNKGYSVNFFNEDGQQPLEEIQLRIRYPKGKDFLLKTWLHKITLIAKAIGLQVRE